MTILKYLLNNLSDLALFLFIIIIFLFSLKLIGINPVKVVSLLFKELTGLLKLILELKPTAAGINMLMVILNFIFGILLIILNHVDILQNLLSFLGETKVNTVSEYTNGIVLMIVLFSISTLSIVYISTEGD